MQAEIATWQSENSGSPIAHQGSLNCAHLAFIVLGKSEESLYFSIYRILQCMFTSATCQHAVKETLSDIAPLDTFCIKMKTC